MPVDFDSSYHNLKPLPGLIRKLGTALNLVLHKLGYNATIREAMDHGREMTTLHQKVNFYHLINDVLFHKIPGEFVELGCYEGQLATIFQHTLIGNKSDKKLYLFDDFSLTRGIEGSVKEKLIRNFKEKKLPLPEIVEGDFKITIPKSLPDKLAFVHIDCGTGGNPDDHRQLVLYCLENIYSRISPGGVCVLMDYHDFSKTIQGFNSNPGVKLACDIFFKDKPESVQVLYGGDASHGYFRKL